MSIRATFVGLSALAMAGAAPWSIAAQEELPPAPRAAKAEVASQGEEVLARGPIHEAFAEAVSFAPKAGVTIKNEPPEAIDEVPPQERPVGENVAWIPGYWGWDDERSDFIWISGVWRTVPPGRQWIAGYWATSEAGSQWVSGYWADAELSETSYYPEPPETRERGPSGDPPTAEHVWIPGVWLWQDGRFAWRRGYWMIPQANWVWCPAHWIWSPSGYVFVDGYWDYALPRRGIVYAPVYIARRFYSAPNYYYRPVVVINPVVFISHLFLRPDFHHCYFGDYYAADYARIGIYPRFTYQYRYGFDPLFAYQTWQHRDERDWLVSVQQNFERLQRNEADRPPRTFQRSWLTANLEGDAVSTVVATSLAQVTRNRFTSFRFEPLAEDQRKQLANSSKQLVQLRQERQQLEAQGREEARESSKAGAKAAPVTLKMPRTPISSSTGVAARPGAKSDGPRRETLKPEDPGDPLREPRGREPRGREPGGREPGGREPKSDDPFAPKETPKTKTPRPGEAPTRPERPGAEKGPRPEREPGAPTRPERPGAEVPPHPERPEAGEPPTRPERPGAEKGPRPEREPGAPARPERPGAEETPTRPERPGAEKAPRPEREPGAPTRPGSEKSPMRPDRPGASKAPTRPERPMDDEFPEPKSKGSPAERERPDGPKAGTPKAGTPKAGTPNSRPAPMDDPFAPGSKARPEPREPKEAPAAKSPEKTRPEAKTPPAKSPPAKSPPTKSPAPKGKDKTPKEKDDKPGAAKPEDEFPK